MSPFAGYGLASRRKRCATSQRPGLVSSTYVEVFMPDENVCQRCEAPLRPSEYTWCVPCARGVWQDIWPGVRDVINGALPVAERTALAHLVAWITGLLSELPA